MQLEDDAPPPWSRGVAVAAIVLCLATTAAATTVDNYDDGSLGDLFGWSLKYCAQNAVCLDPRQCDSNAMCGDMQDCQNGVCVCRYPFPDDYVCYDYNESAIADELQCNSGVCSLQRSFYGYSPMTELMPLALTTGVCFVVAVTAMLVCKMLIKRMHAANPATRLGDGDTDSVSSMQRWINQRLRDRPPRYEEMVSEAASSSTPAAPPTAGPATISAAVTEAEKPPAYEVVVNERTAGAFLQGPAADNVPPPLYSAEAAAGGAPDGRQCYGNPCFLGDAEDPPPYYPASPSLYTTSPARNTRSASLPDPICASLFDPFEPTTPPTQPSDSPATPSSTSSWDSTPSSPTSSLGSFVSASSSAFPLAHAECDVDLLTVSQAVALKEMLMAEGLVPAVAAPSVERTGHWTSSC